MELRLGDEASLARVEARRSDPLATSDADYAVYRHQQTMFEEVTSAEGRRLALDASLEPGLLAEEIAGAICAGGPHQMMGHFGPSGPA